MYYYFCTDCKFLVCFGKTLHNLTSKIYHLGNESVMWTCRGPRADEVHNHASLNKSLNSFKNFAFLFVITKT